MKRVFLSFTYEDIDHARGFRLLGLNPNVDIDFYDESVKTPFNSDNAPYIKSKIKEKITRSSKTVCLVSSFTASSHWVEWEVRESHRQGNAILFIATKDTVGSVVHPSIVKELGDTIYKWNIQTIQDFLNK